MPKTYDVDGNLLIGKHYCIYNTNFIIHSPNRVVINIGRDDVVIVDTEDAILICDKKRAQEVKEIRNILEAEGLEDCL